MNPTPLPKAYDLLADIALRVAQLASTSGNNPAFTDHLRSTVQELTMELWRAGQVEHRAMDCFEYDPPLYCRGESVEMVTARVGVPWTVNPSGRDVGRGRSYR